MQTVRTILTRLASAALCRGTARGIQSAAVIQEEFESCHAVSGTGTRMEIERGQDLARGRNTNVQTNEQ